MRTIPALSVLCLRAVGSSRCSAEETFAKVPESTANARSSTNSKSADEEKSDGSKNKAEQDEKDVTKDDKTIASSEKKPGDENTSPKGGSKNDTGEKITAAIASTNNSPRRTSVLPVDIVKKVPSTASRLLDAFHGRGTTSSSSDEPPANGIDMIPIERTDVFSARRRNANDIDLNHPWIAVYQPDTDHPITPSGGGLPAVPIHPQNMNLVSEYSNPSLEVLQTYVDALVEMGRMDDSRLGLHFFQQVKRCIELGEIDDHHEGDDADHHSDDGDDGAHDGDMAAEHSTPKTKRKKRGRGGGNSWAKRKKKLQQKKEQEQLAAQLAAIPTAIASFSLHNSIMLDETLNALTESKVLPHMAVLDLTGIATLTDDMLLKIVSQCGVNLRRLSIKNCRRLTGTSLTHLVNCCSDHLTALDIGGTYNIKPDEVLTAITPTVIKRGRWEYPHNPLPHLVELHASGLHWSDEHLAELFKQRPWRGISLGFSQLLSFPGFKDAILDETSEPMCSALQSLALPFCESLVTNALLGVMGRHLPHLRALDVRGANQLTSLTGWYDGRSTIHDEKLAPMDQSLVVLARYSGITKASYESTLQDIPEASSSLTVVLDSGGVGLGILRMQGGDSNVHEITTKDTEEEPIDEGVDADGDVPMEG